MRSCAAVMVTIAAALSVPGGLLAADGYPRTIVASAKVVNGATTVTSQVTIKVNRLVEPARRDRVINGLKANGYQGFMDALRPLPTIGSIATQSNEVMVRYAWETEAEGKKRLIVVADKPLFFLAGDAAKTKAGFELTFVELVFDAKGGATGTMAGAARVKPAPNDGIVLQDFATEPVQLTVAPAK
jgi:hypothetical protein